MGDLELKLLKIIGIVIGLITAIFAVTYVTRTDPIFLIAGKQLSGNEVGYPSDWTFTDKHMTVFVESRPEDPHSVTTSCWVHEGELYIPAQSASSKSWTHYVLDDPSVRIKVGDKIYPAQLERVPEKIFPTLMQSRRLKYGSGPQEAPKDVWIFRVSQR